MYLGINDKIQLLKRSSFRRAWNATKVLSSYFYSKWKKKPIQWGVPMAISIEPTTACNLACPECPSGLKAFTRPTGNLQKEMYQSVIDQLHKDTFYLTFYFQGEPYINKNFLEMVEYANQKNIYTATSTNAHFLDDEMAKKTVESGLDRLIISIDGATQETYESYRKNGSLEKVLAGTKNIVKWKKKLKSRTPHIIFQFLVVRPNEHEVDKIKQMGKEYGIDEVRLKTAQVYDFENGNPLIPTIEKYSRYDKEKDGTYSIKSVLADHCWRLWHACVITWDGKVLPCCFDKDAKHQLGDLQKNSFKEVWQGAAYQNFRQQLFKGRDQIDICKNCTEGCKVWES